MLLRALARRGRLAARVASPATDACNRRGAAMAASVARQLSVTTATQPRRSLATLLPRAAAAADADASSRRCRPQQAQRARGLASAAAAPEVGRKEFALLLSELRSAALANDADKAAATARRFPRMPSEPTQIVYNCAIGTCVRAEKLEQATELLNALVQSGVPPTLLTYNLLVFGAARKGDWQQAQQFRDEMVEAKIRPDESTYHGLLMACGKGKEKKMVPELLTQMDVRLPTTYTTALAALARCGAVDEALALVKEMEAEGLEPQPAAYHAAMFACTKGKPSARWTECLDLLREMKAKGLPVGLTAYNTAILCAGLAHETAAAERLLAELRAEGLAPNNGSYRGVVKSLAKSGSYQACVAVLDGMKATDGVDPDLLVYTDAMEVFAKSQNPGATLRVLEQMKLAKQPDLRMHLAPVIDADEAAEGRVHEEFVKEVEALAALRLLD